MTDLTLFYPPAPPLDPNKWMRPALMTSASVEWYTPEVVLRAVTETLGTIDLDPCADDARSVPARAYYTEADNGLGHQWSGRVYMNPPYGRGIIAWTTKLRDELHRCWVTEAIALLPARVDTRWWQELAPPLVCFLRGRLTFSGHEQSAPFPSAAAYFGRYPEAFRSAFRPLGLIYQLG